MKNVWTSEQLEKAFSFNRSHMNGNPMAQILAFIERLPEPPVKKMPLITSEKWQLRTTFSHLERANSFIKEFNRSLEPEPEPDPKIEAVAMEMYDGMQHRVSWNTQDDTFKTHYRNLATMIIALAEKAGK